MAVCLIGEMGGFVAFHVPSICLATQCIDRKGTRRTRNFNSLILGCPPVNCRVQTSIVGAYKLHKNTSDLALIKRKRKKKK